MFCLSSFCIYFSLSLLHTPHDSFQKKYSFFHRFSWLTLNWIPHKHPLLTNNAISRDTTLLPLSPTQMGGCDLNVATCP